MNEEEKQKRTYGTSPKRLYKSEARVVEYFRDYSELPIVRTAMLKGFNSELEMLEYILASESEPDTKKLEEIKINKLALEIGIMRIREMLEKADK